MSANAEHLKALVRAHAEANDDLFYSVALQVAAKSARQGQGKFAVELRELGTSSPAGSAVATPARVTARTAAASMLIRVQRIQEFQQVAWPWSRPQTPLASWKSSSTRHLRQTRARAACRSSFPP
jgi:hypothetical protein